MKAEPETPDLKWITLDCSLMEPPEPMLRVLEQLDRLKHDFPIVGVIIIKLIIHFIWDE